MHRQNEVFPHEKPVINDFTLRNRILSLKRQPEVNEARQRVLFIVGVLFGFSLMNFILIFITYVTKTLAEAEATKDIYRLTSALFSIVYYGFGLFVTRRYSRTGLLIFAWLGLLFLLICAVIIVAAAIFAIKSANTGIADSILVVIILIIIFFIASLLQIFAVRYAFVLSKLLKNTKPLTTEQI